MSFDTGGKAVQGRKDDLKNAAGISGNTHVKINESDIFL